MIQTVGPRLWFKFLSFFVLVDNLDEGPYRSSFVLECLVRVVEYSVADRRVLERMNEWLVSLFWMISPSYERIDRSNGSCRLSRGSFDWTALHFEDQFDVLWYWMIRPAVVFGLGCSLKCRHATSSIQQPWFDARMRRSSTRTTLLVVCYIVIMMMMMSSRRWEYSNEGLRVCIMGTHSTSWRIYITSVSFFWNIRLYSYLDIKT